jgi:UDP-GlcNAc:undecaprenyl-phosphate GlcNAc-1-phosphate transferase
MRPGFYITVLSAALASFLLAPLVVALAYRVRLLDVPGPRRVHRWLMPRLGGLVMIVATLMGLAVSVAMYPSLAASPDAAALGALLGGATMMFLLGLADDLYGLGPVSKLAVQFLAAVALCAAGARVETLNLGANWTVHLGVLSWPVSVFWIVLITNAMNLVDGLDGLAAGISLVTAGAILAVALLAGQVALTVVMLALMGALAGFLRHNFHPARIFLGDCGSLFLGYMLAGSTLCSVSLSHDSVGLALPALALGVPLVDTLASVSRRLIQRRSIFSPDRQHIHHRLLDAQQGHLPAVLTILAVTVGLATVGTLMLVTHHTRTLAIFCCAAGLGLVALRSLTKLDLRQTYVRAQKACRLAGEFRRQRRVFEECLLVMRESKDLRQWWDDACRSARTMGFQRLVMELSNRDGAPSFLQWQSPDNILPYAEYAGNLQLSVWVRHRRPGPPLRLTADLRAYDLMELGGMKAAMFGRLLDEFSIADLPEAVQADSGRRRQTA